MRKSNVKEGLQFVAGRKGDAALSLPSGRTGPRNRDASPFRVLITFVDGMFTLGKITEPPEKRDAPQHRMFLN
jgi:hypothetical protein